MKRLIISILIIFCAFNALGAARKALVIGNAAYGGKALKNPVNDATDLAASLQALGFATVLIKDADYAALYRGIESFTEALVSGDEAIFYFSGHGVQIADTNYLIPVGDRKLSDKIDYDTYAISATWALGKLARARVSVMILDACRDNPTLTRSVSAKKGLAKLEPASGSQYVIYATEKDTEAFDGEGRNSPFAASLLKHMQSPVRVGDDLMRLIRSDVRTATAGQQVPTAYGILDDDFYLAPPQTASPATTTSSDTTEQGVEGLIAELGKLRETRLEASKNLDDLKDFIKAIDNTPPGMVYVEGGSFMMGSYDGESDERPVHMITISSFFIGKYEVTKKEWLDIEGASTSSTNGKDFPIDLITWYDAVEYCNARSIKEGLNPCYSINKDLNDPNNLSSSDNVKWTVSINWEANGYRLPTEAEWEYAARAGSRSNGYLYSGSDDIGSVAWYIGNSDGSSVKVGNLDASELGTYDMSGNVWEWCWDWYDKRCYSSSSCLDGKGASSGSERSLRGGSWDNMDSDCRTTNRDSFDPGFSGANVGFRVVRSVK
ncbi:MAG TPA: SUMF1/EgtB/PvdO family nonheme iron enzyme [Candidatus Cloacimonadota bacterium]|nr:SUMF1/EgtB/PvdO family nonheme iron enzyme [Candidatus Cloacimonadota bacterium]